MTGAERIAAERRRQIEVEGWTPAHDDRYMSGELLQAGQCYALFAWWQLIPHMGWTREMVDNIIGEQWPWDESWWKPSPDPARNMEKVGALIAAEIDKLQRQEAH